MSYRSRPPGAEKKQCKHQNYLIAFLKYFSGSLKSLTSQPCLHALIDHRYMP